MAPLIYPTAYQCRWTLAFCVVSSQESRAYRGHRQALTRVKAAISDHAKGPNFGPDHEDSVATVALTRLPHRRLRIRAGTGT